MNMAQSFFLSVFLLNITVFADSTFHCKPKMNTETKSFTAKLLLGRGNTIGAGAIECDILKYLSSSSFFEKSKSNEQAEIFEGGTKCNVGEVTFSDVQSGFAPSLKGIEEKFFPLICFYRGSKTEFACIAKDLVEGNITSGPLLETSLAAANAGYPVYICERD